MPATKLQKSVDERKRAREEALTTQQAILKLIGGQLEAKGLEKSALAPLAGVSVATIYNR